MLNFGLTFASVVNTLPNRSELLMYTKPVVDSIGNSSITLTTGSADDIMAASFPFLATAVMLQADADEGGDVFFDSADSMAPITRYGYEWYALLNSNFVWIGPHASRGGVVVYSADMAAYASRIQSYLGYYAAESTPAYKEDGTAWLKEDGTQVYQE